MEQQEIIEQPEANGNKRPTAIKVICILALFGAAFTIPLIFSAAARNIGSWYPPYLALAAIIGFICFIGLWNMKKWAAYTYAAFCFINQVVLLSMGVWNIFALVIPGIVIAVAFSNIKKMD